MLESKQHHHPKQKTSKPFVLPHLPQKLYFAIGEICHLLSLKPHVIRHWVHEFHQLKPIRRNGRDLYRYEDVIWLAKIKHLIYENGFAVEGARTQLAKGKSKYLMSAEDEVAAMVSVAAELEVAKSEVSKKLQEEITQKSARSKEELQGILDSLNTLLAQLEGKA
jgi:DNA-binding transcriptional MerR regulator